LFTRGSPIDSGAGSVSRVWPRIRRCLFYANRGGAGFGEGRGGLVADGRGWPPEDCLEIGHGEGPNLAGRITPAEIGELATHVPAIFRGDPLRRERLAASQTAPLKPPLTKHAPRLA
jgi:hypothetical protein